MSVNVLRDFAPADRYLYDFKVLTTDKGWAQLDSKQDASYYGQWINPVRREIFCYCEGDCILTQCETADELLAELARIEEWNTQQGFRCFSNGKPIAIDPGFNEQLKSDCVACGLLEYLH